MPSYHKQYPNTFNCINPLIVTVLYIFQSAPYHNKIAIYLKKAIKQ